jgi:hypothetical protein
MRAKAHVPLSVTIESVELTKSSVLPLIAPSEAAVLEVNLMELTRLKYVLKAVDTAMVYICIVLVPRTTDLVEVT